MALTVDHLHILKAPFLPEQHEFLRGMVYIRERAITDRIEDVDPAWTLDIQHLYTRDNSAVCEAKLTICGTSRDGVGMANIKDTKRDGTEYDAADPEKSAATDALKRAARLFGVGRYLLDVPENVKDMDSLARWLNGTPSRSPAPSKPTTQQPAPAKSEPKAVARPTWDTAGILDMLRGWCMRHEEITSDGQIAELALMASFTDLNEWRHGYSTPDDAYRFIKLSLSAPAETNGKAERRMR